MFGVHVEEHTPSPSLGSHEAVAKAVGDLVPSSYKVEIEGVKWRETRNRLPFSECKASAVESKCAGGRAEPCALAAAWSEIFQLPLSRRCACTSLGAQHLCSWRRCPQVDLSHADKTILVVKAGNLCTAAVVPDWHKLHHYNVQALTTEVCM